jgi:hypothetical protein
MYHQKQLFTGVMVMTLASLPFVAIAITSTNYILDPSSSTVSTYHTVNSTNYRVDGTVGETVAGLSNSANYKVFSGAGRGVCGDNLADPGEQCDGSDFGGATCVSLGFTGGSLSCSSSCTRSTSACTSTETNTSGNTSGGGGYTQPTTPTPTPPTVKQEPPSVPTIDPSFTESDFYTYSARLLIHGTKDASATSIEINDTSKGVTYPTETTWNATVRLRVGVNTFNIVAENKAGKSNVLKVTIIRREPGDLNNDKVVNDYDLSEFIKSFGKTDKDKIFDQRHKKADLDGDGKVDDYDLSILVSRWDVGA